MAQEVIWSSNAKEDLKRILDYWVNKNGNEKYSLYLLEKFREFEKFLKIFPKIGRKADSQI